MTKHTKNWLSRIGIAIVPMAAVYAFDYLVSQPLSLYRLWPSFDIPMHLIGGFVTAWSALIFFRAYRRTMPFFVFAVLLIGVVSFVGIAWEWYEFIHDQLYPPILFQPSIRDTMGDLFFDIVGAVSFVMVLFVRERRK